MKQETIYEQLKNAGQKMDHHYSDLYVEKTPESEKILKNAGVKYSTFTSQIDKKAWLDIPFAYDPYWDAKNIK